MLSLYNPVSGKTILATIPPVFRLGKKEATFSLCQVEISGRSRTLSPTWPIYSAFRMLT